MRNEWILDVLLDLRGYAQKHGMDALSAQLDTTRQVAAAEIAFHMEGAPVKAEADDACGGNDPGGFGARYRS